mmetsp:Transcript_784/g.2359  ORF Transcript_784/g.2359 Transcript_784/m.2359 type:complete len:210 (-) Transcript_784:5692-6321(-)
MPVTLATALVAPLMTSSSKSAADAVDGASTSVQAYLNEPPSGSNDAEPSRKAGRRDTSVEVAGDAKEPASANTATRSAPASAVGAVLSLSMMMATTLTSPTSIWYFASSDAPAMFRSADSGPPAVSSSSLAHTRSVRHSAHACGSKTRTPLSICSRDDDAEMDTKTIFVGLDWSRTATFSGAPPSARCTVDADVKMPATSSSSTNAMSC